MQSLWLVTFSHDNFCRVGGSSGIPPDDEELEKELTRTKVVLGTVTSLKFPFVPLN